MSQDLLETKAEEENLHKTLAFIQTLLETEKHEANNKEEDLISYRREMYENASHHSQDFNKLAETVQYLNPLAMQTMDYEAAKKRIELYEKMYKSPYFARVDFETPRWGKEKIYIGIGNLEDEDTFETLVYDWRAPISSIFYRYEIGPAQYEAPVGTINGEVTLKRQYEIKNGKLEFFFDSNVNIVDDMLKEALSKNTSTQMKTIVETIQREQDTVIRDIDSDLLMVQGVAGSGKTSIALHRAAYLMYQGLNGRLKASNITLISPNNLFAQYIASVLPDLGEENISTITFEKIFFTHYGEDISFNKRTSMLEEILTAPNDKNKILKENLAFKNSGVFQIIIDRLISYYEHHMVVFTDIMYGGKVIAKKELLKSRFLESSSRSLPLQVRLNHIETIIRDRIKNARPQRIKKIEEYLSHRPELMFDIKQQARLLNTKQVSRIMKQVRKFTHIDYLGIYKKLFSDKNLFKKLSQGLNLPDNIDSIVEYTKNQLESEYLDYNDAMVLLLLKLKLDSTHENVDIRQVIVDEAQDYSSVHFEILSRLYPAAKYTVLGDVNQMIVDLGQQNTYSEIERVLHKKRNNYIALNKSFRCSYEISMFAKQFAEEGLDVEHVERHEKSPDVLHYKTEEKLTEALLVQLAQWKSEGYETIGIVCKSASKSRELYKKIAHRSDVSVFTNDEVVSIDGTVIMPVYMVKGLEFDAVIVYDADSKTYSTKDDKKLLYVACTRALHRLTLMHTGERSPLIQNGY